MKTYKAEPNSQKSFTLFIVYVHIYIDVELLVILEYNGRLLLGFDLGELQLSLDSRSYFSVTRTVHYPI